MRTAAVILRVSITNYQPIIEGVNEMSDTYNNTWIVIDYIDQTVAVSGRGSHTYEYVDFRDMTAGAIAMLHVLNYAHRQGLGLRQSLRLTPRGEVAEVIYSYDPDEYQWEPAREMNTIYRTSVQPHITLHPYEHIDVAHPPKGMTTDV